MTTQPDRIRQFGLPRRRDPAAVAVPDSGGGQTRSPTSPVQFERSVVREVQIPPQQPAPAAFQSPLLDYYTSLGGATVVAGSQPPTAGFSGAAEPHRWTTEGFLYVYNKKHMCEHIFFCPYNLSILQIDDKDIKCISNEAASLYMLIHKIWWF